LATLRNGGMLVRAQETTRTPDAEKAAIGITS